MTHRALPPHPIEEPIAGEDGKLSSSWGWWFELVGELLTKTVFYTPILTPASVAANTTAEETFTVTGLKLSDRVFVIKPTAQAGLGIAGARVSAADTVAINFINTTGSSITPTASETYQVIAMRGP